MAKVQVHFKCLTDDKSGSISNCDSTLRQMIFGESGGEMETLLLGLYEANLTFITLKEFTAQWEIL